MENKNNFEVSVDTEKHLLYADVTVHAQPEWKGIVYYSLTEVLKELNKQGYNLKQRDCVKPNKYVLRSDNGNSDVFVGRWVFTLASIKEKPEVQKQPVVKEKPVEKPVEKPAVQKKPATPNKAPIPKKKPTPKPTKKQTTKEILEAYEQKNYDFLQAQYSLYVNDGLLDIEVEFHS